MWYGAIVANLAKYTLNKDYTYHIDYVNTPAREGPASKK